MSSIGTVIYMKVFIRQANINDSMKVYELSNDNVVRANSINKSEIELRSHITWYKNKLASQDCFFYIIETNIKNFVGYIRCDLQHEDWILTIHLNEAYRGKGIGVESIKKICDILNKNVTALIKTQNQASYKCFLKAGFKKVALIELENQCYYKVTKNKIHKSNKQWLL